MKKILCLLLSLCLAAVLAPAAVWADPEPASAPTHGDVDRDGTVTTTDARLVLQRSVEKIDDNSLDMRVADVDGDEKVTSTDARMILQLAVGKITRFPSDPAPIEIPQSVTPHNIPDPAAQKAALKRSADTFVLKCADNAVINKTGDPSVQIVERTVLEEDEYLRYLIRVVFETMNGTQTLDRKTVYMLLKISSVLDGSYTWTHDGSGWENPISGEDKSDFGWESQPEDWTLDSAPDVDKAIPVTLEEICEDPARYRNKLVRVVEKLAVGANNLNRNSYYVCAVTGEGVFDYNADRVVEVVYDIAPNLQECRDLKVEFDFERGYKKIQAIGYVRIYANVAEPYIQAVEVTLP